MQTAARTRRYDPLNYGVPLPFEAEFYPMGFPLRVATNWEPVLDSAAMLWSRFSKLFDRTPLRLKIVVEDGPGRTLPGQEPRLRGQEHLLSIVLDPFNFGQADLTAGFAHLAITREVAGDLPYLRYHFMEPLAYVLIAARHVAFVHAACVELEGGGVILCGSSGAGKTCLAYACARRGWTFVSGDAVAVVDGTEDFRITGRPFEIRFRHTATRLFPELARFPRALRPSGKTDVEVDPQALNLTCALQSHAGRLVVLERRTHDSPADANPISPIAAREVLEEAICFGDSSLRERHGRALDRLAQIPAFRLRYSDLDSAERSLRAIAKAGKC